MEITLATLGRATRKHAAAEELFSSYIERIGRFARCNAVTYPTEERFFAAVERLASGQSHRKAAHRPMDFSRGSDFVLTLLDSRGRSFSTEQFAQWLQRQRDQAVRHLLFAVGPPDGWSEQARTRAALLLSLGPMTLPHELAAVVLAEQVYRAFTIVEGHPYHLGHR